MFIPIVLLISVDITISLTITVSLAMVKLIFLTAVTTVIAAVSTAIYLKLHAKVAALDREYIKKLISLQKDKIISTSISDDAAAADFALFPLMKTISIVTGCTSGIGREIAAEIYSFGGTVILAGRSHSKIEATLNEIKEEYPNSKGTLQIGVIDTSDFNSVNTFTKWFKQSYKKLDFLINNAGIHYVSLPGEPLKHLSEPFLSKQGYDLAFATNYMGHFLLTNSLLPLMTSSYSRVVQISSSYHSLADGKMLQPQRAHGKTMMPVAADGIVVNGNASSSSDVSLHRQRSYSNNKLAQILHAKELQRRLNKKAGNNIKVTSVCPSWVSTNILPKNIGGKFVHSNAFSPKAAVVSVFSALFNDNVKGGEFITNSVNFFNEQTWTKNLYSFATAYGFRDAMCHTLSMWILSSQSLSYGDHISTSSPESYDEQLAAALYDWTDEAVKEYL